MSRPEVYVSRLAPAPTGALHLGNARTFLVAWLRCRSLGGRLLLRLEDLDHPKVKPGAALAAYRDLAWLGLDWDQGPRAAMAVLQNDLDAAARSAGADADDPFVQSNRTELYREAFSRLRSRARVYACTCSRRDIMRALAAPHAGEELRYPGTCRGRPLGEEPPAAQIPPQGWAWRWRVEDERETTYLDVFAGEQRSRVFDWSGDFVIAREGGRGPGGAEGWRAAYQLAVVVDDHAMRVTEVVRGDDLALSTHRQLLLYEALGWKAPAFLHLPLVVGPDGRRLAKRHGDTRIAALRAAGMDAEEVVGWLARACGLAPPGSRLRPADLLAAFSLDKIPREPVTVPARFLR